MATPDPAPAVTDPPALLPPAPTCPALTAKAKRGLGLTATLKGRPLSIKTGRGKIRLRVTTQAPCGKETTVKAGAPRRGRLAVTVPGLDSGSLIRVTGKQGGKTALVVVRVR